MQAQDLQEIRSTTYQAIFDITPAPMLILLADSQFTISGVNDAYLKATMRSREDILGKGVFEAFPANPENPDETGTRNLLNSLKHVVHYKEAHVMNTQQYDIPKPGTSLFQIRNWSPQNLPVFDNRGELVYIIHTVTDITQQILYSQMEQKALEQLKESEQNLRNLIKQAPVAMCILRTRRIK